MKQNKSVKYHLLAAIAILSLCGCSPMEVSELNLLSRSSSNDSSNSGNNSDPGGDTTTNPGGMPNPAEPIVITEKPPLFDKWEADMIKFGKQAGESWRNATKVDDAYYDGQRVMLQIAQYTGNDKPWLEYAQLANRLVQQRYNIPNNFKIPGYRRFSHGLLLDYLRFKTPASLDGIRNLRDRPAFSDVDTSSFSWKWYWIRYNREIAFALESHIVAELAGEPRKEKRYNMFLDMAKSHVEQWNTGKYLDEDRSWHYAKPFMAGLTAIALIQHYDLSVKRGAPDNEVPGMLLKLADKLWNNVCNQNYKGTGYAAFYYTDLASDIAKGGAPDLNQLIAPLYAWAYKYSGDKRYLQAGDKTFAAGVQYAFLAKGKQFDQSYRNSFDFLLWRQEGIKKWGK